MNAKRMVCYVVGGLTLTGAVSTAQAAWMAPTGGWQLNYEASSGDTPDVATPAWVTNYQTTTPGTNNYMGVVTDSVTSEQTLELRNTATSGDIWPWTHLDSGAGAGTASDEITLDFRFRLVDGLQANDQWGIGVRRPSSTPGVYNDYLLNFGLGRVINGNTFAYQGAGIGTNWHDARLLIDVAGNTADLYLDGDSLPTYSITGTQASGTSNQVWFGDGQGSVLGQAEVSYIRLTNSEFASVIPEPASIGILALGGSMLMTRRRRQH